jgi:hypothetical protein
MKTKNQKISNIVLFLIALTFIITVIHMTAIKELKKINYSHLIYENHR